MIAFVYDIPVYVLFVFCFILFSDVWFIGDSYVYWAERRAWARHIGTNLGVSNIGAIHWDGVRGMRWGRVRERLQHLALYNQVPKAIMLHVGGNDLGMCKSVVLSHLMREDILFIFRTFPRVRLIVSGLVPRLNWPRSAWEAPALERVRKQLNGFIRRLVQHDGGIFLPHSDISVDTPGFYYKDGVHLSDVGTDLFLLSFRDALEILA